MTRNFVIFFLLTKYYSHDRIKQNEMGRACDKYVRQERCILGFDRETLGKGTTWKTQVQMGGQYAVAARCSRNHFISEKYKTVHSLKLRFLPKSPLVQLYNSASDRTYPMILTIYIICTNIFKFCKYFPDDGLFRPKLVANI